MQNRADSVIVIYVQFSFLFYIVNVFEVFLVQYFAEGITSSTSLELDARWM